MIVADVEYFVYFLEHSKVTYMATTTVESQREDPVVDVVEGRNLTTSFGVWVSKSPLFSAAEVEGQRLNTRLRSHLILPLSLLLHPTTAMTAAVVVCNFGLLCTRRRSITAQH